MSVITRWECPRCGREMLGEGAGCLRHGDLDNPPRAVKVIYEPVTARISLQGQLEIAHETVKRAVGCEHPDTCGGPLRQPICEPCIAFAREHLWTTSLDPIE